MSTVEEEHATSAGRLSVAERDTGNGASVLYVRFLVPPVCGAPSAHGMSSAGDAALPGLVALLEEFSPVVEAVPPDAALVDVRGAVRYFGRDVTGIASVIRVRALALYGVECVVGIGPGPLAARAAARGAAPGTILAVPPGEDAVARFLAGESVTALPAVGPATARTLREYGLRSIGEVAAAPLSAVQRLIGVRLGRELHERARGIDRTRVVPNAAARSLAAERSFGRDELDPYLHRRALLSITGELGVRLRAEGQVCRSLTLTVRCVGRTGRAAVVRDRTLSEPTAHSAALTAVVYRMYEALGLQRARVRVIAVRAGGLGPAERAAHQLTFDPADEKARRIEEAADRARARFGPHAVVPGTLAV